MPGTSDTCWEPVRNISRESRNCWKPKEYKRMKRDLPGAGPLHPGRRFVLAMYVVGIASQAGISLYYLGHLGVYAAIFLPWAGYFNAKVIFWRSLFKSG